MAYYAQLMAEDNGEELSILKQNLARALQEDVTPRQREMLQLYYGQGMTMREIACYLQVDRTTVSRTIKRGEQRLRRCLRYGGAGLLQRSLPEPKKAVRQKNNPNS
jgi:RNA polymerase sigma factor (sigma-70 family)